MKIDDLAFYSSHETSSKPANLHELLQYQDWRFVEAAYEILLARKPDQDGYGFYLTRVRNGARKIQILKEISRSPEASPRRKSIKGLRTALFMDAIGSLPVIGNVFRRLVSLEGDSKFEVRLRILEQKNSVAGDVVAAIVGQLTVVETSLNQVPQLVADLNKQLTSLAKRSLLEKLNARDIQSLAQSVEDLRQRQSSFAQSAEALGQLQSTFAQFVEDFGQRQSACAQSVENLGQRQSAVETQLPTLFQTLSDLNQRQLASDNDRDNLTKSVPVALRKLAREIAEGDKKMTDLEALLESRYR